MGVTTYLATLFTGVGAVSTIAGHYAADFLFNIKEFKKDLILSKTALERELALLKGGKWKIIKKLLGNNF